LNIINQLKNTVKLFLPRLSRRNTERSRKKGILAGCWGSCKDR